MFNELDPRPLLPIENVLLANTPRNFRLSDVAAQLEYIEQMTPLRMTRVKDFRFIATLINHKNDN